MKTTVLICGGAGFLGSNFVKYIIKKHPDYQVVNIDLLNTWANLENLKEIDEFPNYRFVKGDISDRKLLDDVFSSGIGFVVNFAVETCMDKGTEGMDRFVNSNVFGVKTLLDACMKYGVKRYIQISSADVYGNSESLNGYEENMPFNPVGPLPTCKCTADLLTRLYYQYFGFPVNILRLPDVYGPFQFPVKYIPLMIINALEGKELVVYGEGLKTRDWIFAEDAAKAVDLVMHYGETGEVYNVSNEDKKSNIEIVKFIIKEAGTDESLIRYIKDKPDFEPARYINSRKIRDELGWKPNYNLEEGLRTTVKWYRENTGWWKKVKNGEYLKCSF